MNLPLRARRSTSSRKHRGSLHNRNSISSPFNRRFEDLEARRLLTADIAATAFTSDNTNWQVDYSITTSSASAFDISVYQSSDGTTLGTLLQTQRITDSGKLAVGSHSESITPNFTDTQDDYFLVVKVDAASENTESNESNNTQTFAGGIFKSGSVFHVQGGSGADTVTLKGVAPEQIETVKLNSGSAVASGSYSSVHVRLHDGADTLTHGNQTWSKTLLVFGGDGNDSLTGGRGDDTLHGGAGNDTINGETIFGGPGNDLIFGETGDDTMAGGAGDDTYAFSGSNAGSDTITEASNTGSDWLNFFAMGSAVTVDLSSTSAQSVATGLTLTLSSATGLENVYGSFYNDSITGNTRDNIINPDRGTDTIDGGTGNDTYQFGWAPNSITTMGSKTINEAASSGTDTIDLYNLYDDATISIGTTATQTVNNRLTLTLASASAIENVVGTTYNDRITGNSLNNNLAGGSGDDTYVFGGTGMGSDTVNEAANTGTDTLDFASMGSGITVDLSSTSAQTVNGDLTLTLSSSTGLENVLGSFYNDTITGNTRDNLFNPDRGTDSLAGGAGNDTYEFGIAPNSISVMGSKTITEASNADSDTIDLYKISADAEINLSLTSLQHVNGRVEITLSSSTGIENLVGTNYNDRITGNSRNNLLAGGEGYDTYVFGGTGQGSDTVDEVANLEEDTLDFGGMGSGITIDLSSTSAQTVNGDLTLTLTSSTGLEDVLGSFYGDSITGNSRDNFINPDRGTDTLAGGAGNDTYAFGIVYNSISVMGAKTISDSSGIDTIDLSNLFDDATLDIGSTSTQNVNSYLTLTLSSGSAIENVIGTVYNDTITGNSLDNDISGLAGYDTIYGLLGADTIHGGDDDDLIYGGDGNDFLYGDNGDDTIFGEAGDDYLDGGAGTDTLDGGSGSNTLVN